MTWMPLDSYHFMQYIYNTTKNFTVLPCGQRSHHADGSCIASSFDVLCFSDTLRWRVEPDGQFSVNAGYLFYCVQNEMVDNWPWKLIWRTKAPPKILQKIKLTLGSFSKSAVKERAESSRFVFDEVIMKRAEKVTRTQ
uniref:Uncharacterized protein isoform X1 n=1 Tax=Nicotiana tabacum TaxID=4097 RepID=A0A1S3ZGX2_TOBAC|nr:PREDICTED: uncharacterized protein LOC107786625 isoform X1 [Nicotiana tabacum]